MNEVSDFRWGSTLGISVVLFLAFGALNVLIGVLIPVFVRPDRLTSNILFTSTRPDTALFGASPEMLMAQDRPLGMLRYVMTLWLGGLFVGFGVLQVAGAWFGLRAGHTWALWSLTVADLAIAPFWGIILARYAQAGVVPNFGELPPLVTYLVLIPVAALLGWIGLR